MWYEDNNLGKAGYFPADAKDKFIDSQSWQISRKKMDVYLIRANALYMRKNGLTDYFLKHKMFKTLKASHIKLALDVRGATLTQMSDKRKKIRTKELKLIEKIESMGMHIDSINFQSALSKSSKKFQRKNASVDYAMEKRIEDIVSYARIVHRKFPHIRFGLIDALPTKGYAYKTPYTLLVKSMQKAHLTLHHIILDLPYDFIEKHWRGMTWEKAIEVEKFVKNDLHLEYGKIYHDSKAGKTSDRLFFNHVMKMATRYKKEGGAPDYCLLMSWYSHPTYTIPETEKYTQMYTFLELAKQLEKY